MALKLNTKIQIDASPEKVWEVFIDFKQYKDWNPFMFSLEGQLAVGEKIIVKLDGMTFKPKVLAFEPSKKLEWIGRFGIPGIVDGKHSFELIKNEDGTTTFIQNELFKGILVPFLKRKLNVETREGFIAMNEALKTRVENH